MAAPAIDDRIEAPPEGLWSRLRSEPHRAPEHVALAALDRFAEPAAEWAGMMRPHYEPAEIGRRTVAKHRRLARLEGAALGLGGIFTAAPDFMALAWLQCRMIFFVAAGYGFDPHHEMRPAELLFLTGIYPSAAAARESLDGVGRTMAAHYVNQKTGGTGSADDRSLVAELARFSGVYLAKKGAIKFIPLIASPINAVENAGATDRLGKRATKYYGG